MILLLIGLVIFAITAYALVKKYNTIMVLMLAGAALFAVSFAFDAEFYTLKSFKPSGSEFIDVWHMFATILASRLGGIGLIIMAAGGFAKYMNTIGAADTFVTLCAKPLNVIKSPYILLALAYIFGQIMNIFIPSAAGLGMLLLVTLYPLLRKLNVSAAAAAAVLATTACLDLGPASGNSNAAANLSGMTPTEYFVSYQMPVAALAMIVIAVAFYFTAKYFDKKDAENGVVVDDSILSTSVKEKEVKQMPAIYALLPILPLCLLILFSKYVIDTIKLDVVTAMIMCFLLGICFEIVRTKNVKACLQDATSFFAGMADMLKGVVLLLVAAEFFALGLQAVGMTHYLLSAANGVGFGLLGMTVIFTGIIGALAFISGSGNAAFLSFSNLAPDVANSIGAPIVSMVMPMQLAAGIFRSMSPVAGVVVAIAGATGVSPIDIVKRTAIPMICGEIVILICANIFF